MQGSLFDDDELFSAAEPAPQAPAPTRNLADLFARLARSKFRSSFRLNAKDLAIVDAKGMATLRRHAAEIVSKRIAPAVIANDGRQTPMRHGTSPIFIAQHATGCCCRGCLYKWHGIAPGTELTAAQQQYIVDVIMEWISRQLAAAR